MTLYEFEARRPRIGTGTYISEHADIIGDVQIGEQCFIGPGARLKGDYGSIRIGSKTNIQENCVLHAQPDEVCTIGNFVTIGHSAILHNCTVRDWAIIGMGAVISDYAVIGEWAAVGEGAVVPQRHEIPAGKIAIGVPAKIIADVTAEQKVLWTKYKELYVSLAERYSKGLRLIP